MLTPDSRVDLQTAYDAMACGVVVRDRGGAIVFANTEAQRLFGRPVEELRGQLVLPGEARLREDGTVMLDSELPGFVALRTKQPVRNVLVGAREPSGEVRWLIVDAVPVLGGDGEPIEVVTSFVDITERKVAEKALLQQALHDNLTGLPNRTLLLDRLEQGIRSARRQNTPLALLLMDLDHFKEVNDALGHQAGDAVLRDAAQRLREEVRESDTVARLGGDEFAILLPGADEAGAQLVARKVFTSLQRPFELGTDALEVGVSIGIALCPRHGEDVDTLLRRADIAMYVAKRTTDGSAVFAEQHDEEGPNVLALMAELRHGLQADEITMVYQPIVGFATGVATRVESLARWRHPERGLVSPLEFVPLAERTGLVKPLFEKVLTTTLRQCHLWSEMGIGVRAAVNLSVRNLLDPELPATVARALESSGMDPESLGLEITETTLMVDPDRALRMLGELRRMGVQLAIDDFGVGYSSLAYLQRLPIYAVKIDRSFVARMTRDKNTESIVRLIIELGHSLGMKVVAEGIEDRQTWDALAALGCDAAQGYYIARPMTAAALATWLAEPNHTNTSA